MTDRRPDGLHHVVLTKYNTRFRCGVAHRGLDADWLDYRLRLFCDGPLFALRNQTATPDEWLIFIDQETPVRQREALHAAAEGAAHLIEVQGVLTDSAVAAHVMRRLPAYARILLTSRIDSDDLVAANYIASIRKIGLDHRGFINPRWGYQIVGRSVLRRRDSSSPFLSYSEDLIVGRPARTVFSLPHHEAGRRKDLLQIGGTAWLQVIHGGNVANQVEGIPVRKSLAEDSWGFRPPALADHRSLSVGQFTRAAVRQFVREAGWTVRTAAHRAFGSPGPQ